MPPHAPLTPAASYGMLPVPQALDIVLQHTEPLPSVTTTLAQAAGKILTHDVVALDPVPPFRASVKVLDGAQWTTCDHNTGCTLAGWICSGVL